MPDFEPAEAVRMAIWKELTQIHTCLPGQIEKYEYQTKKASVKPLLKKRFKDGSLMPLEIIENVPVVFPSGGSFSATWPLERGDGVLLLFSERSLDNWLSVGGDADPGSPTMFDLSDAIAIPGLNSFAVQSDASSSNKVEIKYKSASLTVDTNGQWNFNDGNLTVDV